MMIATQAAIKTQAITNKATLILKYKKYLQYNELKY